MIFINRPETDPYFNIAAEEYILKNFKEDLMMLWQSKPSVIIGKHQNALTEVNFEFIEKNNIPFIRRISGGGTIYHDLNNINYTVIRTGERKDRLIDFREFLKPLIDFLTTIGIHASFEGKNNLIISGKKISGNAAHVFKNRILHHGTLLFSTDLEILEKTLIPLRLNIEDKAVQSIRKVVTNISDNLTKKLSVGEFKVLLQEYLFKYHDVSEIVNLNESDILAINKLADEKYRQWKWNYGYSPKYTFRNETNHGQIKIEVKNGMIAGASVIPDTADLKLITEKLIGLPHRKSEILAILNTQLNDQNKVDEYAELLGF